MLQPPYVIDFMRNIIIVIFRCNKFLFEKVETGKWAQCTALLFNKMSLIRFAY